MWVTTQLLLSDASHPRANQWNNSMQLFGGHLPQIMDTCFIDIINSIVVVRCCRLRKNVANAFD